jgi:hypothetical protein
MICGIAPPYEPLYFSGCTRELKPDGKPHDGPCAHDWLNKDQRVLPEHADSAGRVFKKGDRVYHRGTKDNATVIGVIPQGDKTLEILIRPDEKPAIPGVRDAMTAYERLPRFWASYHTEPGEWQWYGPGLGGAPKRLSRAGGDPHQGGRGPGHPPGQLPPQGQAVTLNREDLVFRLKKRAEIRRQISTRKSVQEGKPDRLAELLDEAAEGLEELLRFIEDENEMGSQWADRSRFRTILTQWRPPPPPVAPAGPHDCTPVMDKDDREAFTCSVPGCGKTFVK